MLDFDKKQLKTGSPKSLVMNTGFLAIKVSRFHCNFFEKISFATNFFNPQLNIIGLNGVQFCAFQISTRVFNKWIQYMRWHAVAKFPRNKSVWSRLLSINDYQYGIIFCLNAIRFNTKAIIVLFILKHSSIGINRQLPYFFTYASNFVNFFFIQNQNDSYKPFSTAILYVVDFFSWIQHTYLNILNKSSWFLWKNAFLCW